MILNNYSGEQVVTLIQAISERLAQVNKDQMAALGLEEDANPLLAPFTLYEKKKASANGLLDGDDIQTFGTSED